MVKDGATSGTTTIQPSKLSDEPDDFPRAEPEADVCLYILLHSAIRNLRVPFAECYCISRK